MIIFKSGKLSKQSEKEIAEVLQNNIDVYGEFYITRNNLRLFIKENLDLFFNCLSKGDKIAYNKEEGIVLVTGFSDKSLRKYIRFLAKDEYSADRLLKVLLWNINCDLYIKIKKDNPLKQILAKNNFKIIGDRGKEFLMFKKYIARKQNDFKSKDEE